MSTGDPGSPLPAPPPPVSAISVQPPRDRIPISSKKTQVTGPATAAPNYAAAASQMAAQTPEQQQQQQQRAKALGSLLQAMGAVPGNRMDRWVQAIYFAELYPVATATSLKFSALNANRSVECEESTLRSAQDLGARSEPGADLGARSEPGAPAQDLGARSEPGT
ncbi:BZ3500_MvSof-1268-A1-R1_Chr12-2g03961 [Microbotryum saponariae]|uniref:BZ3500_MvSof-1268-A1-R1_Chr12-2g03961 protein n=1 Tax=Microbotryum saponariae TaxID=289078 RepID=A0A2X0KNQ0_9BASI|nr:BZ3500_MvSof-1268-A1-R1_Chr12-2g03961 [Microbotryum saponariae]